MGWAFPFGRGCGWIPAVVGVLRPVEAPSTTFTTLWIAASPDGLTEGRAGRKVGEQPKTGQHSAVLVRERRAAGEQGAFSLGAMIVATIVL